MPIGISRARAYRLLSFCLMPFSLLLISCQSRKDLNEDLAKTLLQEAFKSRTSGLVYDGYRLDRPVVDEMYTAPTVDDYSQPFWLNVNGPSGTIARLLKAGYMTESSHEIDYVLPRHLSGSIILPYTLMGPANTFSATLGHSGRVITGTWTASKGPLQATCTGGHIEGYLAQGSNAIYISIVGGGYPIAQIYQHCFSDTIRYMMQPTVSGSRVQLNGLSQIPGYTLNFTGDSPETVRLAWHSYDWTAKHNALLPNGYGNACEVGTIQARSISNLVLQGTETQATANFLYRVVHNDFGTIVEGGHIADGLGFATFTKKPDGTWVLSSFQLTNHV